MRRKSGVGVEGARRPRKTMWQLTYWVADTHRAVRDLMVARKAGKHSRLSLAEVRGLSPFRKARFQKEVRRPGRGRVRGAAGQLARGSWHFFGVRSASGRRNQSTDRWTAAAAAAAAVALLVVRRLGRSSMHHNYTAVLEMPRRRHIALPPPPPTPTAWPAREGPDDLSRRGPGPPHIVYSVGPRRGRAGVSL